MNLAIGGQRSVLPRAQLPHFHSSLTHLPFTGVWSKPYGQAPYLFQTRASWLIRMGINTIRPR